MDKRKRAEKILKEHVLWSLGAGLLPIPVIDVIAVSFVQLDMLKQLCRLYEKSFSESEGKATLSALTGGTLARLGATMLKALPGIGTIIGGVSMSIMSGASTYAVARVAIRHFESGGAFFDFDLDAAKKVYDEEFEKGKEYASTLEEERKASGTSPDDVVKKLEQLAQLKEKGILPKKNSRPKNKSFWIDYENLMHS
jgi:uncharacterized protein (DUF697 family)